MQTLSNKNTLVQRPEIKMPTGNNWSKLLLEFLLAMLVVVFLLESIFAMSGIGEQECLRIDKELGFSLFENKNITWRREGFSRVKFNSFGMQDQEYTIAKPDAVRRIAVIGDSYVEALQVDRKDNFCNLLRDSLNKSSPKVEVLNFGIQAHNLSQTYLNLKKSVIRFAPDIVILPFRPDATYLLPPDIKSGFLSARPNFFVGQDGKLIEDRTVQDLWLKSSSGKRMQNTSWLRKNSHIWGAMATGIEAASNWKAQGGLLKNFLSKSHEQHLPGFQAGSGDLKLEERSVSGWTKTSKAGEESIKATWPVANALIADMKRQCSEKSCKLIVARLPGVNGHVSELETTLLKETCRQNSIPYLDLTDIFHRNIEKGKKLFLQTHLNEEGHTIVADCLYKFIESEELLKL